MLIKMRNTFLGLFVTTALFTGTVHGAESSSLAQDRAVRYQQEVRSALARRGWRITRDEAGELTAERRRPVQGGTDQPFIGNDINKYIILKVTFRAEDRTHTAAAGRVGLIVRNPQSTDGVSDPLFPPIALRDPKITQGYHEVLAEADSRLTKDRRTTEEKNIHKAFAAKQLLRSDTSCQAVHSTRPPYLWLTAESAVGDDLPRCP